MKSQCNACTASQEGVTEALDDSASLNVAVLRYSAETPAEIRQKLSADRWNDFHAGKRVLVIDDNQVTAGNLQAFLGVLYGQVDVETESTKVLKRIEDAKTNGAPYDVLVLDLYMPQKTGVELLKDLAEKGEMPAVVINTASMMSQTVADISSHMDSYRSRSAFEKSRALLADSAATSAFGMLVHFKLEGMRSLVDKIDAAQLFHLQDAGKMLAFWQEFNPLLVPVHYNAESVHHFCEHLQNFLGTFREIWDDLRKNETLQRAPWLKENTARIEKALNQLEDVSFGTLMDDTPDAIRNRIHTALNAFATLNPGWAGGTSLRSVNDARVEQAAKDWQEVFAGFNAKLDGIYTDFQCYHAPAFDFLDFCTKHFGNMHGWGGDFGFRSDIQTPALRDPERAVRSFLIEYSALMRSLNGKEWKDFSIHPSFRAEQHRTHEREDDRKKLDAMNCGSYFMFNISFDCQSPSLDPYFLDLLPRMSELLRKGVMRWDSSTWMNGATRRWQFDITIKATDKSRDFPAEVKEKARKKPDGTRTITTEYSEIEVSEDLGRDKNIVVLGSMPDAQARFARPVFFKIDDRIIFANKGSHIEGCNLIAHYLNFIKREEPDSPIAARKFDFEAGDIYRDCLRLRFSYGGIALEELPPGDESKWPLEALEDLGMARKSVEISAEGFAERPDYR